MIVAIIQARTGSSRFPRKIYEDINGRYTLQRVLKGVSQNKMLHKIILAMPLEDKDEFHDRVKKGEFDDCVDHRFLAFFGDPDDVLKRYYDAAVATNANLIVRITADCPFGGTQIDEMLLHYFSNNLNGFLGNLSKMSPDLPYPDGMGTEIFPFWMLADTMNSTQDPRDREHVTFYMYESGRYPVHKFENAPPNKTISTRFVDFSFDTQEDLELINKIAIEYDKHGDLNKAILDTKE